MGLRLLSLYKFGPWAWAVLTFSAYQGFGRQPALVPLSPPLRRRRRLSVPYLPVGGVRFIIPSPSPKHAVTRREARSAGRRATRARRRLLAQARSQRRGHCHGAACIPLTREATSWSLSPSQSFPPLHGLFCRSPTWICRKEVGVPEGRARGAQGCPVEGGSVAVVGRRPRCPRGLRVLR